jgi:ectoine hydroxylase-related dioxygenase (phytanoyl-CoA dioxygenase family)/putative sterol carrier protein
MQTTLPRATRSTLDRVDSGPEAVSPAAAEAVARRIAELFAERPGFSGRVELQLDETTSLVVDGDKRSVSAAPDGKVDARVLLQPRHVDLMLRRVLDARQALVFGQMQVKAGSMPVAVQFGDFLTGRPRPQNAPPGAAGARLTRDWDKAQDDLDHYGYALVEGALEGEQLATLRRRSLEQAAAEREVGRASVGETSQRVWNLVNKGREFHDLLLHPLIERIVPALLGEHALLQGTAISIALPGNASGIMHYDQVCVQPRVDFPIGLNILWFLDDVAADNGGTRVMPGSHRADVAPDDLFSTENTIAAEGPAGTALLLDSRVWHAVGHNITDKPRHVVVTYFNRAFMRTQENYALSLRPEVEAELDERVRVMLGFRCTASLGGVEGPVEGKMVSRPHAPLGDLKPSTPLA